GLHRQEGEWQREEILFSLSLTLLLSLIEQAGERRDFERELAYRKEFQELVMELSNHFIDLAREQIDEGIVHALRTIGEFSDVDRSYLFLFREDRRLMDNTHEWCARGIEPHQHRLQGIPIR